MGGDQCLQIRGPGLQYCPCGPVVYGRDDVCVHGLLRAGSSEGLWHQGTGRKVVGTGIIVDGNGYDEGIQQQRWHSEQTLPKGRR